LKKQRFKEEAKYQKTNQIINTSCEKKSNLKTNVRKMYSYLMFDYDLNKIFFFGKKCTKSNFANVHPLICNDQIT
jgi:hypothetical protein